MMYDIHTSLLHIQRTRSPHVQSLAPDLKRKVDEIRAQRAGSAAVREKLEVRTCRALE